MSHIKTGKLIKEAALYSNSTLASPTRIGSIQNDTIRDIMGKLCSEDNVTKQLQSLRQAGDQIDHCELNPDDYEHIMEFLFFGMATCSGKSSAKSAALGLVEKLYRKCERRSWSPSGLVEKVLSGLTAKQGIELLTAFLECDFGRQCLAQGTSVVLTFYEKAFRRIGEQLREQTTTILKADLHHDLHLAMCCMLKVLQLHNDTSLHDWTPLIDSLHAILLIEDIPLDLRNSCARAIVGALQKEGFQINLLLECLQDSQAYGKLQTGGELSRFETLRNASSYVKLSLCAGLLSTLNITELLSSDQNNGTLLGQKLFCLIIEWSSGMQETSLAIQSSRCVELWSQICCDNISAVDQSVLFAEEWKSTLKDQLFEYLLSSLEHQVDVVRYSARSSFDSYVVILTRLNSEKEQRDLAKTILSLDENKRSKYMAIASIAIHWGPAPLLEANPQLPLQLLRAATDPSLCNHVKDAYKSLVLRAAEAGSGLVVQWTQPLLQQLAEHPDSFIFAELLEVLVKVKPETVALVQQWLSAETWNSARLRVFLTCLVACKKLGLLPKVVRSEQPGLWRDCIELQSLKSALYHQEEKIRILAFSLIIDHSKSSQLLLPLDLELLRGPLENSMKSQNPAFRNQLSSLFKKLLVKIKDGVNASQKKAVSKIPGLHEAYSSFVNWTVDLCLRSLDSFSSFPRRSLALAFLLTVRDVFGFQDVKIPVSAAQTLLEALNDSYESNKEAALSLLSTEPLLSYSSQAKDRLKFLFEWSTAQAQSVRPPQNASAAFVFRWMARLPTLQEAAPLSSDVSEVPNGLRNSYWLICHLTDILSEHIEAASCNLLRAAVETPIHGVLLSIRSLLSDQQNRVSETTEPWAALLRNLVRLCFEACRAVAPVVNNSSPEGHLPMDAEPRTRCLSTNQDEDTSGESKEATNESPRSVSAQLLLVCSWRTVKEASLFLGDLCSWVSIGPDGILGVEHVRNIVDHFARLLMETKHRGAFEQAYAGFSKVCYRLWISPMKELHEEPQCWLNKLIDIVRNPESETKLCATRRSAGIPFLIQAILAPKVEKGSENVFRHTLQTLLDLAESRKGTENLETRTHVLNILRAIYRDSRLGEAVGPFVARGLILAITGFEAPTWAERNSSTLLFTTLMTRIFGVPRTKVDLSRKNSMTGRVFFRLYPDLYPFLLGHLNRAAEDLDRSGFFNLQPALYPILMVLSRLHPPASEAADSTFQLAPFVPLVRQCAAVPVYKTRELAAQALTPLVTKDKFEVLVEEVMLGLCKRDAPTSTNRLHGTLLQLHSLLRELGSWSREERDRITTSMTPFILERTSWILGQPCCTVKRAYMELVQLLVVSYEVEAAGLLDCLLRELDGPYNVPDYPLYCKAATKLLCLVVSGTPEMLLKLLRHPLYEVRYEVLLKLLSEDPEQLSQQLIMDLIRLERDPSCLALLLKLLSRHAGDCTLLEDVLNILERDSSETVRAAALEALAVLIDRKENDCTQVLLSEKWAAYLWKISSGEESVPLRFAAARAVEQNPVLLTKLEGNAYLYLWTSLFHLLVDEEEKIRQSAETAVSRLIEKLDNVTADSLVPLEQALEIFVFLSKSRNPAHALAVMFLFPWNSPATLTDESSSEDTAFDKGSSSSVSEPLILTEIFAKFVEQMALNPDLFSSVLDAEFLEFLCNFDPAGSSFNRSSLTLAEFFSLLAQDKVARLETKNFVSFGPNTDLLELQQSVIAFRCLSSGNSLFSDIMLRLTNIFQNIPAFYRTYAVQQLLSKPH